MPGSPRPAVQFRHASASPLGSISICGLGQRQTLALGQPRVFGQYALVYLLQGTGSYEDALGYRQSLQPGDLILVFPELSHLYNPTPGTSWVTSFLCFQGPAFDLLRQPGGLDSRQPVFHLEPIDEWNSRVGSVLGPTRGSTPLVQEDRRWLARACSLLESRLDTPADWPDLAREFGLTAEGFRKRFTRLAGQPPARYRSKRLIDRACELISEARHTDSQIAEMLGFCDEFYFSRRFKEITGQSPRAFRQNLLPPLPRRA